METDESWSTIFSEPQMAFKDPRGILADITQKNIRDLTLLLVFFHVAVLFRVVVETHLRLLKAMIMLESFCV